MASFAVVHVTGKKRISNMLSEIDQGYHQDMNVMIGDMRRTFHQTTDGADMMSFENCQKHPEIRTLLSKGVTTEAQLREQWEKAGGEQGGLDFAGFLLLLHELEKDLSEEAVQEHLGDNSTAVRAIKSGLFLGDSEMSLKEAREEIFAPALEEKFEGRL